MDRASLYTLVHDYRSRGFNQTKIADLLSISQPRVSQILKHPTGVLPQWGGHKNAKLSSEQKTQLSDFLEKGAEFFGFEGAIWTSKRVKQVIEEQFGVLYHVDTIPDILREIGFTPQKPQVKDRRQNPEKIKEFIEITLPDLKKSP
jgi:transposase